jgi:hypothetical protein
MTELILRLQPRRLLIVVGLVAICATAGFVAAPALATNEYYECNPCTIANGPENFIKNNFGINHSNGGICAIVWRNDGGGKYTNMETKCKALGGTAEACAGSEVYGHGEASSVEFGGYLRGRQDNLAGCK